MHVDYQISEEDFIHALKFGTSVQSAFGRFHLARGPLFGVSWIFLVLLYAFATAQT